MDHNEFREWGKPNSECSSKCEGAAIAAPGMTKNCGILPQPIGERHSFRGLCGLRCTLLHRALGPGFAETAFEDLAASGTGVTFAHVESLPPKSVFRDDALRKRGDCRPGETRTDHASDSINYRSSEVSSTSGRASSLRANTKVRSSEQTFATRSLPRNRASRMSGVIDSSPFRSRASKSGFMNRP